MTSSRQLVCFLIFSILLDYGFSIRWLSLQHSTLQWTPSSAGRGIRSGTRSPCAVARRRYGFARQQAKLCRTSTETMPHVQKAAVLAAETCQRVFQGRRWNCSSITTAPHLTPDLLRATREQAYVYAISSAALTYQMARACSGGALYRCTCAAEPQEAPAAFQWGGCGDNVRWGVAFAKRFVDNVEKNAVEKRKREDSDKKSRGTRKEIAAVNLHNNRVGRKVIKESLQTQCKCHGVSGSCNIKTCWKGLPPMIDVGQRLLKSYTNAVEMSKSHVDGNLGSKKASDQLIFIAKSPDYCTKDEKLGSFGTVGRRCNVTTSGPDSCRQLCCGRGYRTLVEEKIERCQCKYYNCCYVKCNICRTMTQIYECG